MLGTTFYEMDLFEKKGEDKNKEYFVSLADDIGLRYPMAAAKKYHQDEEEKLLSKFSTPKI